MGRSYLDGTDLWPGSYDGRGLLAISGICICDWNGWDVPPYSNAVYSDGL